MVLRLRFANNKAGRSVSGMVLIDMPMPEKCSDCIFCDDNCSCVASDYTELGINVGCAYRTERRDIRCPLKEQEKNQITLHKKHIITWMRNDEFSMKKLYEAICETLLDSGELFIARTRTDDHEKVDFVFYVAEGW